ncbi:hypothetical protein [Luteirhabdus pelagi]|uniref:hypothetical protein n=1 Tax=Luteirhabdus pelagi TaxID=2792783 RepID=UPI00193A002A|nr:hypothetical protein [Luteirhabdus pelagi]
MRITSAFLILLMFLSCRNEKNKISKTDLNDFQNIQIKFLSGDERTTVHRLSILKDESNIRIIKKQPFYFYGSQTDSTWEKQIDRSELQMINAFIEEARNKKDTCQSTSSWREHYEIKIGNNELIKLIGNCDWLKLDYNGLEKELFKEYFNELEQKRLKTSDSIISSFIGDWKVLGLEKGYNRGAEVNLIRIKKGEQPSESVKKWSFGDHFRKRAKKEVDIDEGSTTIDLNGSIYRIIRIKSDTINLEYLWS